MTLANNAEDHSQSLRKKLTRSYFVVILIFFAIFTSMIVLHLVVVQSYRKTAEVMITEYRLLDKTPLLISAYYDTFRFASSVESIDGREIEAISSDMDTLLAFLDNSIIDQERRNYFLGLKNTIHNVQDEINDGLNDLREGKIENATSHYDSANKKHSFVQKNATTLILSQLHYMDISQKKIDTTYAIAVSAAGFMIISTFIFTIVYVVRFSKRITVPLQRLKVVAQKIASGDQNSKVPQDIIKGRDEIGSLAGSFSTMLESLLESNKKHDALLLSIGDGVIATNSEGVIEYINEIAQELLQVTENEALGKPYGEVWTLEEESGKAQAEDVRSINRALREGVSITASEYYFVRNISDTKKIRIPVSETVSPITINGIITGIVSVFHDITKEKEVDRMKTEFISLASHQLKTPLSAISWFGEMLDDESAGKLNEQQKDLITSIRGSALRMTDLVNALLNISRIESGRIMIEPVPMRLQEMIQTVVDDLSAKIEAKHHEVRVDIPEDMPEVNVDRSLLSQIYMNLLSNAVKYTPENGKITVSVYVEGDEIISKIQDNGYGIPKEEHDKMFQKFFRADNALKVETDGTGLGMYLVKSVLDESGGRIWFESELNQGTTFWFAIPKSGMKAKKGEVGLAAMSHR